MNFRSLIPPFAQDDLGSDAAGYGFLMAASGLGSLLAARAARDRRPAAGRSASRPARSILGVASVAAGASRPSFPLVARC